MKIVWIILLTLIALSLALILITGSGRAENPRAVLLPAVINPVAGMRGDCWWPNIYDRSTRPACWCVPTPDEGPDYVPWGCWEIGFNPSPQPLTPRP